MYCSICNSPSSGSTLLADLLDASMFGVCGPELNFFSNVLAYKSFNNYRENPFAASYSSSLYKSYNALNHRELSHYGLCKDRVRRIAHESNSFKCMAERVACFYTKWRDRPDAVWFEKTPENIDCIKHYIDCTPCCAIHIVRNPLNVAYSLWRNRGFSLGTAIFTWLFDVAHVVPALGNERLIEVRYEQLVEAPWQLVSNIVNRLKGCKVLTPQDLEKAYTSNPYRIKAVKKVASWGVNKYGVIRNANKPIQDERFLRAFRAALDYRVSDDWAHRFSVEPLSYRQALSLFGYEQMVMNELESVPVVGDYPFSALDKLLLLRRAAAAARNDAFKAPILLMPVSR